MGTRTRPAHVIVTIVVFVAAFYSAGLIPSWLLLSIGVSLRSTPARVISIAGQLAIACGVTVLTWRRLAAVPPDRSGLARSVVLGGVIGGGLGFAGGAIFGPLLDASDSYRAQLLALVTGPLGFLLGLIGGTWRWGRRAAPGDNAPST